MNGRFVLIAAIAVLAFGQTGHVRVLVAGKGWSFGGKGLGHDQILPAMRIRRNRIDAPP